MIANYLIALAVPVLALTLVVMFGSPVVILIGAIVCIGACIGWLFALDVKHFSSEEDPIF